MFFFGVHSTFPFMWQRDFVSGLGICLPIELSCRWVNMPSVLDAAEVFHQQSLLLDKADKRTMGQRAGFRKVRLRLHPPTSRTPQLDLPLRVGLEGFNGLRSITSSFWFVFVMQKKKKRSKKQDPTHATYNLECLRSYPPRGSDDTLDRFGLY